MEISSVKTSFGKVPAGVRIFLLRALLFFVGWLLLYHLLLLPLRVPDRQLTNATAWSVVKFAGTMYSGVTYTPVLSNDDGFANIFINSKAVLSIADGCNALDLMVLYVCFLCCVPTTARRVLFFASVGAVSIFILNVIRCTALIWVGQHMAHLFNFAHKYLFTAIVYCFIFLLWVLYAKKYTSLAK